MTCVCEAGGCQNEPAWRDCIGTYVDVQNGMKRRYEKIQLVCNEHHNPALAHTVFPLGPLPKRIR